MTEQEAKAQEAQGISGFNLTLDEAFEAGRAGLAAAVIGMAEAMKSDFGASSSGVQELIKRYQDEMLRAALFYYGIKVGELSSKGMFGEPTGQSGSISNLATKYEEKFGKSAEWSDFAQVLDFISANVKTRTSNLHKMSKKPVSKKELLSEDEEA